MKSKKALDFTQGVAGFPQIHTTPPDLISHVFYQQPRLHHNRTRFTEQVNNLQGNVDFKYLVDLSSLSGISSRNVKRWPDKGPANRLELKANLKVLASNSSFSNFPGIWGWYNQLEHHTLMLSNELHHCNTTFSFKFTTSQFG